MAKPVEIGQRNFPTQKAALDHFKELLHRYVDGQLITDSTDHSDLVALIERYDRILEDVGEPMKGCGQIKHFERRLNTGTGWSSSGFWLVREDGSETDFSYITAVKGQPGDRSKDFYGACREAVALDNLHAKRRAFDEYGDSQGKVECELTGVMVSIDESHLDHAWPHFSCLVLGFRTARGWSKGIPDGIISPPTDGQTTPTFVDDAVSDAFRNYHHNQAKLRILSKSANLETASQARRPSIRRPVKII